MSPPKPALRGIFPPIPTPFDAGGALDLPTLRRLITRMAGTGIAGVATLGSNGEAWNLDERERLQVIETVRGALPPTQLLVAGTGHDSTLSTIAFTRRAAQVGADMALVVTPVYYRRHIDREGWLGHYRAVAEASPIPVVIYSVPVYTGVDLAADVISELALHPNIVGLKDSSGDVPKLAALVAQVPPGFAVLAGSFNVLTAALAVGARGAVTALANLVPQVCVQVVTRFEAADLEQAERLQRAYEPVNSAVTARWGVPGLKAAMALGGTPVGPPRSPLRALAPVDQAALAEILQAAGLVLTPA
jgi:4-hydroxy-2-oxoglutarate aldolase